MIRTSYAFIMHQLMTINGMFIFFIIPILVGFSHIFFLKYFENKKYILYVLLILSLSSTVHYWHKYINKRDFMDLRNANMSNYIDAISSEVFFPSVNCDLIIVNMVLLYIYILSLSIT